MPSTLAEELAQGGARVAVIGAGYVGLAMAVACAEAGYDVVCHDIDRRRVAEIAAARSPVETVDSARLRAVLDRGALTATAEASAISGSTVAVICVPTPLAPGDVPDTTHLEAAARTLGRHLAAPCLVIVESTSYPGSIREVVLPSLAERLGRVGEDFYLACVPERIDPGSRSFSLVNTPRLVGGVSEACTDHATALYRRLGVPVHPVASPEVAETAKLLENAFRCVNIALVNEVMRLCDALSVEVDAVIEAAATKPFGYMRFDPGVGVGGECIPVDPRYLAWRGRRDHLPLPLVELALDVNAAMPAYAAGQVKQALNARGLAVCGARVLVCGVAYKPNVGDVRNAPALRIIELLAADGATVSYHDPHVPEIVVADRTLSSTSLNDEAVRAADLVALATRHDGVDHAWLGRTARAFVDLTRRRLDEASPRAVPKHSTGPDPDPHPRSAREDS